MDGANLLESIEHFEEFECLIVSAYEALRRGRRETYSSTLVRSELLQRKARRVLNRRDRKVFDACVKRTVDVVRKCSLLGLQNLGRRLEEFQIRQTLKQILEERSAQRRRAIAESESFLLAA